MNLQDAPITLKSGPKTYKLDPTTPSAEVLNEISLAVIELEAETMEQELNKGIDEFAKTVALETGSMRDTVVNLLKSQLTPVIHQSLEAGHTIDFTIDISPLIRNPKIRRHLVAVLRKREYKYPNKAGTKPMDFNEIIKIFEQTIFPAILNIFTARGYTISGGF